MRKGQKVLTGTQDQVVYARARPVIDCKGSDEYFGRTKPSMKDECDINLILARYKQTGMVSHLNKNQGRYADVSEVGDFREAVQMVAETGKFFMGLPAAVRAEFNNDPAEFLDFMSVAEDGQLAELGLESLRKPPEQPAEPQDPVSEPSEEPET